MKKLPPPRLLTDAELLAWRRHLAARVRGPLHVFVYGSLMWNPGLPCRRRDALARGWSRRLCIFSTRYRGTLETPGLVFGLDAGGACRGALLTIAARRKNSALDYLLRREIFADLYTPRFVRAETEDGVFDAVAFVARRSHPHYAGALDSKTMRAIIARAAGQRGSNAEYILRTAAQLRKMGVAAEMWERLCR